VVLFDKQFANYFVIALRLQKKVEVSVKSKRLFCLSVFILRTVSLLMQMTFRKRVLFSTFSIGQACLGRDQSKHQSVSGFSGFHGIADSSSDRRAAQSAFQGLFSSKIFHNRFAR
jgi:hypothetical protein